MLRSARSTAILTGAALGLALLPLSPVAAGASTTDTVRLAGLDRYATSAAISRWLSNEPGWRPIARVASGETFADGLSAASITGHWPNSRLLLVPKDGALPTPVGDALRLSPAPSVRIVGGTGAVGRSMEARLVEITGQAGRAAGTDRYATAAALGWAAEGTTVYVASGETFPDALAAGAVAGGTRGTLLLTRSSSLPDATRTAMTARAGEGAITKLVVVGGPAAVTDAVVAAIRAAAPRASVTRVPGSGRYATAAAVSRHGYPQGSSTVFLASGEDLPDALVAGAAAGARRAPLLLTARDCVPRATLDEISRLGATTFVVVGGTGAVTARVVDRVPCRS